LPADAIGTMAQLEHRSESMGKISARNVIAGTVKEVKKGATTSHVEIDVKGVTVMAAITNEAVEDLALKPGVPVDAVIKSSDVIIALR
jgi:molybdopterin-binding protein